MEVLTARESELLREMRMAIDKNMVETIRVIEEGLMQTLKVLRERIQRLESEKAGLLKEIEELREEAEERAETLEDEVSSLKEEVQSLKELLGYTERKSENIE